MDLFKPIILFLQRPFPPIEKWHERVKLAVGVSLFVLFFLFIFEPFGLNNIKENKFWICAGFGLATLLASLFFELIVVNFTSWYKDTQHFTFGKWVLLAIGMIFTISTANFLYGRWLQGSMDWRYFPQMIYATFTVGVFPTVLLGYISMVRQERKYRDIASDINPHYGEAKELNTTKERSFGNIHISDIRYIESYQNYVKIGHLNNEAKLIETMQRATLKSLQSELQDTSIVKCHRSYLVNKEHIISVSGNAQGLLLELENCEKVIPVSRSFVSAFR